MEEHEPVRDKDEDSDMKFEVRLKLLGSEEEIKYGDGEKREDEIPPQEHDLTEVAVDDPVLIEIMVAE